MGGFLGRWFYGGQGDTDSSSSETSSVSSASIPERNPGASSLNIESTTSR